ncbi:MAG TPA: hypothetical protein VL995_12065 [Cellvibrio sp.]|nr:hypothetical protein [Cellvibrio sp.]
MNFPISPFAWIHAIVNHRQLIIEDPDMTISMYGNDDSSYMVVEHYFDAISVNQYVVDSESNASLKMILALLGKVDYDALSLLSLLEAMPYKDSDVGCCYVTDELKVIKRTIVQQ